MARYRRLASLPHVDTDPLTDLADEAERAADELAKIARRGRAAARLAARLRALAERAHASRRR